MRFDPTNPDAVVTSPAVFVGSLERGAMYGSRMILGNFKLRRQAQACADAEGGEVAGYMDGKYKRGWCVLRVHRSAAPALSGPTPAPAPLDLSVVTFDFSQPGGAVTKIPLAPPASLTSAPTAAREPAAPAPTPSAPAVNIIPIRFPRSSPWKPAWQRARLAR